MHEGHCDRPGCHSSGRHVVTAKLSHPGNCVRQADCLGNIMNFISDDTPPRPGQEPALTPTKARHEDRKHAAPPPARRTHPHTHAAEVTRSPASAGAPSSTRRQLQWDRRATAEVVVVFALVHPRGHAEQMLHDKQLAHKSPRYPNGRVATATNDSVGHNCTNALGKPALPSALRARPMQDLEALAEDSLL